MSFRRRSFRVLPLLFVIALVLCASASRAEPPATYMASPSAVAVKTIAFPGQTLAPAAARLRASLAQTAESTAPVNLVAAANGGRIVSVSDEQPDFPATHLIDGEKLDDSQWFTSEPQFPQTVVFALAHDELQTINRVVLNPWSSDWRHAWVEDFEIYVSDTSPELDSMTRVGSFTLDYVGVDQSFTFDPVPAKYVALVVTSNQGSDLGTLLNEFEVYAAPAGAARVKPGDVAAAANGGHIVSFSSQDPNGQWAPENLIDGRNDAPEGWSTADLSAPQYVVVAFKDNNSLLIDHVVLNPYSDGYADDWIQSFELRASNTSASLDAMQSLGRFTLDQVAQDQTFTFAPVKARYLALLPLTNYGGSAFGLNELEVYAAPAPARKLAAGQAAPGGPTQVDVPPHPAETQATPGNVAVYQSASTADNIDLDLNTSDIVPSVYHLYGPYFDSLASSTLTNRNGGPVTLRVQADVPHYTEVAVETITLAPGESQTVAQNPPLLPGVLEQLNEAKKAGLHVQVDYIVGGERRLLYEGTQPLTIWARGDVLLGTPGYYDPFLFHATLATPSDPSLDSVLREAADRVPGGTIVWGYGDDTDSDNKVYNNLKAIYDAVADRGVIYVAAGIPYVPLSEKEQGFYLQRIKLPYEVLETRSGMCVETSLLFSSLYEKIQLDPVLIRIPGHVFLAVPIAEGSSTYYIVETTLVGRASFDQAVAVGAREFAEAQPSLDADKLDNFFWLNLSQVRDEGITPIPWR